MAEEASRVDRVVDTLVERLLRSGIDGTGKLSSAQEAADAAMKSQHNTDDAIDAIVKSHTRLAATGGFLTGIGGFVTLPVALPANVIGFYVVATRMVAAIAAVRGHDLTKPEVRTAILLALSGDDATEILRKAGGGVVTGRVTAMALKQLPPTALMAANKGVAFRIFVKLGQKGLSRFGRMVPLAGGVLGGAIDAYAMRRIAKHARRELLPMSGEITSA